MAAEASFSTDILSISEGSNLLKAPTSRIKPSITYKGSSVVLKVPLIRTVTVETPNGLPVGSFTCTPAIFPTNTDAKFGAGISSTSFAFMLVTAPATFALLTLA